MHPKSHMKPILPSGRFQALLVALLCAATFSACSAVEDGTLVRGKVTDQQGTQKSRLGGQGTLAAASMMHASAIDHDGSLMLLAEAEIMADGSYEVRIPADARQVVMQAVDEAGAVLASAVLEATGSASGEVIATPMDSESSVEAEVFMAMVANGLDPDQVDTIDLRSRIDEATAAAVRAAEDSGDAGVEIAALAEAAAAAQAAELHAYAEAGIEITQSELFAAELAASQALSAALHHGDNVEAAYEAFFEGLAQAAESLGAGASHQAEAQAESSVSWRLIVDARAGGQGEMAERAMLAAAALEARAWARAVEVMLQVAGAAGNIQDTSRDAGASLVAEVSAAASMQAATDAFFRFSTTLIGEATASGSILGTYLELDAAGTIALDSAVDTARTSSADFDAAVHAGANALLTAGSTIDIDDMARLIVDAWSAFRTAVTSGVAESISGAADKADVGAQLVIVATGSLRATSAP